MSGVAGKPDGNSRSLFGNVQFPVRAGSMAVFGEKHMGKVTQVIEAAGQRNVRNALRSVAQQVTGDFQTVVVEILNRGLLKVSPEHLTAFASADVSGGGNVRERQLVTVTPVDKRDHIPLQFHIRTRRDGNAGERIHTPQKFSSEYVQKSDNLPFVSVRRGLL